MRYLPAAPLLSPGLLLRASHFRDWPSTDGMRLFSHARYALSQFVKESGVAEGLLYVPSYICVDAVEPLERLGQEICYYPVKESLEPDFEWLALNHDSRAKAIVLVHYFGFPNALDDALAFCRERGLLLIEDCAHSLLTRLGDTVIGGFGDAGFYSLHKILPVPDGGGLVVKGIEGAPSPDAQNNHGNGAGMPYRAVLSRLIRFGVCKTGVPAPLWRWWQHRATAHSTNGGVGEALPSSPQPMTKISRHIMCVLKPDFERIVQARRENYRHLAEAFLHFPEVSLPYPVLSEGVCPYVFPVQVQDRASVIHRLRERGIPAQGWPALPKEIPGDPLFEVATRYARNLLTLPVHQDLDSSQIDYILDTYIQGQRASSLSRWRN